MLLLKYITTFGLAAFATAYKAPVSRDSPRGVSYVAEFNTGAIKGFIRIYSRLGFGRYHIDVTGLPTDAGPIQYNIHGLPVPSNGDCLATRYDFNPYGGIVNGRWQNEFPVGDLSGKHGHIRSRNYKNTFFDVFLSLNPRNRAFIGDFSIVFHQNFERIACANLKRETAALQDEISSNYEYHDDENEDLDEGARRELEKVIGESSNLENGALDV